VKFSCWNATDEITRWMIDTGHGVNKEDFVDVWGEFQDRGKRILSVFPSDYKSGSSELLIHFL